jgi:endonuclease/exonuclease/phosphatase family metal-dependent hydrolase
VTLDTPGSEINADLTIQGGAYGWTDFSNDDVLASKVSGNESYTRRILMKFDTQNNIPAGAVIQSAKLHLVLKQAESSETRELTAYHVNRSFVRWEANWYQFRNGQYWSTPGGDLGRSFGRTKIGDAEGWTYTVDLTAMVQAAVNGEFGSRYTRLALVDEGWASGGNYKEFHSTRASNSSVRPRLVITYGGSASSPAPTPSTSEPEPEPSTSPSTSGGGGGGGSTLRVMQWNVKKTKDSSGACNPGRVADIIAQQNADVVSLNEVNFYSGECAWSFDMADHLESLLQQRTGVEWYRQIVNVYGGTSGYGNVLLSKYRPASQGSTLLSYQRGVAFMTLNVNGRNVHVFSTHVEYYNSSYRTTQISQAVAYMGNFSGPKIMMGDFNTWPGTSDYNIIATPYQDAWVAAQNSGSAWAFNGTGATHGDSRFDYVFYGRNSGLSVTSVKVPYTDVSDHHPVVAEFIVN